MLVRSSSKWWQEEGKCWRKTWTCRVGFSEGPGESKTSNQINWKKYGIKTDNYRKSIKIKINKLKYKKKRGKRKSKINTKQSLRFLGVNAAGLASKILTFKKILNELNPAVFFIEETKFKNEGRLKLEKYQIFERLRKSQDGGGGLALGCLKELQPVWVREGDDIAFW